MTDIINEEENTTPLPEEEQETTVVDNGQTYVSEESAIIAQQAAQEAKLWAEESEAQANIATRASDDAAQAKDDAVAAKNDAVAAKEYAEAAVTDVNVVAVGTDLRATPSNIKTVANNISDVTTVAGISSNVTTVAGNTTNINTVAGISSNVTTVATNISNVNNVSSISSDVTTVSGISSDVTAVASNATDISAVAANNTNITAVANNATNINAVNANKTNIDTVAGISSDVSTVATNNTNVTTVANNVSDVNSIATNITNVNTTATNINAINTAATNIVAIQNAPVNAQLARDWAVKMDGLVSGEDYSAKYYADQAKQAAAGAVVDGVTINRNLSDELQTIGVIDDNGGNALKTWTGTLAEYNAIVTKDSNTLYWLTDGNKIYKGTTLIADNTVVDQTYDGTSVNAQSGVAVASAISGKANDTDVVHKTGNEIITGSKTFTGNVHLPYGTLLTKQQNNAIEGGQLYLEKPQNTSLTLNPFIDMYGNWLRFVGRNSSNNYTTPLFLDLETNIAFATASDAVNSVVTTTGISKSENGFVKLGNGIIIQWGRKPSYVNPDPQSVTFPTPFTSTNYKAVCTYFRTGGGVDSEKDHINVDTQSTTGFTFRMSDTTAYGVNWIAIGY